MIAVARIRRRAPSLTCKGLGCPCARCDRASPLDLLAKRKNASPSGWSYKLDSAALAFALDGPVAGEDYHFDDTAMSIYYPFAASQGRDRVGDLLEVAGIETEHHQRMAVAYLEHGKHFPYPIGLDRPLNDEPGPYTVEILPDRGLAVCTTFLSQHLLEAEQAYHLYREGLLRGGSIGYRPLEVRKLPADPEDGHYPDKNGSAGLHLIRVELLETTLTGMPCNADAIRRSLEMGCCGKSLAPALKSLIVPRAGKAPVWSQGWAGKAKDEGGRWITLDPSGTHVHLNTGGNVDKGPPGVTTAKIRRKKPAGEGGEKPANEEPAEKPQPPKEEPKPAPDDDNDGINPGNDDDGIELSDVDVVDDESDRPASSTPAPVKPARPRPDYVGKDIDVNADISSKERKAINQATAKSLKRITSEEKKAIFDYTEGSYKDINQSMRECPPNFECVQGKVKEKMNHILAALDKCEKFAEPVTVYRGMRFDEATGEQFLKLLSQAEESGEDITFPSITSTSIRPLTGLNFSGFSPSENEAVGFQIKARSGLYAESLSANSGETEIITSPKTRYRVVGVARANMKHGSHDNVRTMVYLEEIE